MADINRKRDRENDNDNVEPPNKKQKHSKMPLLESLTEINRTAIIDAYKSGNQNLFDMVCNNLNMQPDDIVDECKEYLNMILARNFHKLSFSHRQQLNHLYLKYKQQKLLKLQFQQQATQLFGEITTDNFEYFIDDIISLDVTAVYPNEIAFKQRKQTKIPKNLHKILKGVWKTKPTSISEQQNKVILQMQYELDRKITNFKTIIGNEYDFRLDMTKQINALDNYLTSYNIKSQKILKMKDVANDIKKYKKDPNWNRHLKWRCADMIQIEHLLKTSKKKCDLILEKIKNRMIDTLGIAMVNNDNQLEMKTSTFAFGTYRPKCIFVEYEKLLHKAHLVHGKIMELTSGLSDIELTGLIGNVSKERRAAQARKMKVKNKEKQTKEREKHRDVIANDEPNQNDENETDDDDIVIANESSHFQHISSTMM
eukprot:46761_1